MKYLFLCILTGLSGLAFAAEPVNSKNHLQGLAYGLEFNDTRLDTVPLAAANIFWRDTTIGTTTDQNGLFHVDRPDEGGFLIFNYVGYKNDTLFVNPDENNLVVYLKTLRSMEKVYVSAKKPHTIHNMDVTINTETITSNGLTQCACCNLAESFENTTSVDVEQSDAVSGARRIKMLGLAGFYTQMMIEKKPVMRGLVNPYALEYVPGFWMESVNISKGTASVATGYESITGQINVELKKPEASERFSANSYVNSMGKTDVALLGAHQFNPKLSTMLLTFGTSLQKGWDTNNDTFIDMPLLRQLNVMNRWKYSGEKFRGQIGLKLINDDRQGGQMDFDFDNPKRSVGLYGSESKIRRYEIYGKGGLVFDDQGSSIGLIVSAFQHDIDSFWGLKTYAGDESSVYSNLTFNKNLSAHKISAGLSYQYDDRQETYLAEKYDTSERVPGVFGEYTFQPNEKFTAMAGLRYDNHNRFGAFFTPRTHLNYRPNEKTSIRLSAGMGYRNPHVFMDNPAILASSKKLVFLQDIDVEQAWNAGVQFTQDFVIGDDKPATLVMDFYRTEFNDQVVVDMESAQHIYLYNLDGQSYSNAAQAELAATIVSGFDVTTAVRYNDVKTTYRGALNSIPLNSTYKGLLVLSYTTQNKKWQLDLTTQFNSQTRLPNTSMNPVEYRLDEYSPNYALMLAQLKHTFGNWEIYTGIENLTNYRQKNPILAWDDPSSPYFDSSIVWGPTFGRRFYVGFRFN
jgi:outer membrane receptor for ferrienterochelin and colicins